MKPVEKYSKGYELARTWVRLTLKRLFYRQWEVRGLEKIDRNKPMLIAANHQNALLDALQIVILLANRSQPIFLARADIFKKKSIATILNWMKIMPVYRIRDGFDSLAKNDEIFEKCAQVLGKGSSLVIFPEGNHGDHRELRILKKGLARVAFGAELARDNKLGLQIVPVGIDYSHYQNFRARVSISIGDPIEMSDFTQLYNREEPQKALRALNEEIRNRLLPHMIHIPLKPVYQGVMNIRTLFGSTYREHKGLPGKTIFDRFDGDHSLINDIREVYDKKPEQTEKLSGEVNAYFRLLKKLKMRDHIPAKQPYGLPRLLLEDLILLIGFPVFLYGMLNNFLIFRIPEFISRKVIKDPQFRSSISYVLAFVLMLPILYLIQTLVVGLVFKNWWITLAYFVSLVPTGLFAIHYSFWFKKTWARWRFWWFKLNKKPQLKELLKTRSKLLTDLKALVFSAD